LAPASERARPSVGDGLIRWPPEHRLDCAHLYRIVLEKASAGAVREMAEAIGHGLKRSVVSMSPEEAGEHFGWLAAFVGCDS
jgi:hypothetical protein